MIKAKKWLIAILCGLVVTIIALGAVTIFLDPFFHYHRPIDGLPYLYESGIEAYMNDGILKNFDYDAVVTGTSMTTNFKTEEINELFHVTSVRATYKGEGFACIHEGLETAISRHPDLKLVIRGLDEIWFISEKDWYGKEEYPTYLYDDIPWNDVRYIYNADVLLHHDIPLLQRALRHDPVTSMDDDRYGFALAPITREQCLANYQRPSKDIKAIDPEETKMFFDMLEENLEENVIADIRDNPDITFYIFLPPYSILYWDSLNQSGVDVIKRRLDMERFAIEKLLLYDNVRLFSFHNNYDLICDLNNYTDKIHYISDINSRILRWMKDGRYEITADNYMDYMEEITDFYCHYDYDAIFE